MVLLNVTALAIYDLFGSFGPFHWLAVISLATVVAGFVPVFLRRPRGGWLRLHAYFIPWSYVGLVAGAVAEVVSRIPGFDFGWSVLLSSVSVIIAGGFVVPRSVNRVLDSRRS
jgi:hypothetical protein